MKTLMRTFFRPLVWVVYSAASPMAAWAQVSGGQPELITDRPDFTESGVVVPKGSVQLEGGLTFERISGDAKSISGPELLVRWGVMDRLEVRLGVPDFVKQDNHEDLEGLGDGSVGIKWQLGPLTSGWDLGLIAAASMPIGDDEFTSNEVDPELILAAGKDLDERWSLGTQISVSQPTQDGERSDEWGAILVTGFALSDVWAGFTEVAADSPEHGETAWTFHTGCTRAIGELRQLDLHTGVGINDAAPDFFIGAGFTWRQ